ncbi:TadE/TadG family type IV pilus assembly protein [Streptomyces sp. NPDC057702]|uniref:TadE/TadG family type IV pilus assembly protein n=1 Tax=unclassified Streptomyces TaxID=2593676 RepID=UPI003695D3FD
MRGEWDTDRARSEDGRGRRGRREGERRAVRRLTRHGGPGRGPGGERRRDGAARGDGGGAANREHGDAGRRGGAGRHGDTDRRGGVGRHGGAAHRVEDAPGLTTRRPGRRPTTRRPTTGRPTTGRRALRRAGEPGRRRAAERDAGSVAIEFLGFLPILLAVGLAVVQLGLAAYTVQQAGTAARAAARTATVDDPRASPEEAGRAAISGWLADGARISVSGGTSAHATATIEIPSVIPGVDLGSATRGATMRRPAPADE